jgi:hypothetical protein
VVVRDASATDSHQPSERALVSRYTMSPAA